MCRLWKRKKMISLFLLLMVIMVTVSPATGTADETDCKKALMKCLVDAGLSGATVNPLPNGPKMSISEPTGVCDNFRVNPPTAL